MHCLGRATSYYIMIFYEIAAFDPNDIVFNPMWRPGCFVLPFAIRLSVVNSWSGWSMLGSISDQGTGWSYEAVGTAHIILAGLCFAASAWPYWDLDVFRDRHLIHVSERCLNAAWLTRNVGRIPSSYASPEHASPANFGFSILGFSPTPRSRGTWSGHWYT